MLSGLVVWLALGAGEVVWSSKVSLPQGGEVTLCTKGLLEGKTYRLVSRGRCTTKERARVRKWREAINPQGPTAFGVDFRLTVGALPPIGVDQEEHETVFTADQNDPTLHIVDHSDAQAGVRCSLTSLEIRRE
jgi:hypothetical protein